MLAYLQFTSHIAVAVYYTGTRRRYIIYIVRSHKNEGGPQLVNWEGTKCSIVIAIALMKK